MNIIDLDSLLQDLEADAPCGLNLEYDAEFLALEQAALGKPEVQYGDTITPAEAPEWKLVKKLALALFERSRDLRVAAPLLRALLALHGVAGFAAGSGLIARLLEERWDSVHPQLDPDDDLDPTLRINSLAGLADPAGVLRELRDCTFLALPGLGGLSLRMLELASGELPAAPGQSAIAMSSVDAALDDADPAQLAAAASATGAALDSIVRIEALLVQQVGSAQALNLNALTRPLRRMHEVLAAHLAVAADVADLAEAAPAGAAGAASAPAAAGQPSAASASIDSRADVVRMLDKLLAYYERHEPSSPVPMLLQRAKRLAPKNFFEIMEDLAPDSIGQLAVIRGPQDAD